MNYNCQKKALRCCRLEGLFFFKNELLWPMTCEVLKTCLVLYPMFQYDCQIVLDKQRDAIH